MNPKLSVVAPVYNESQGIRQFIDAVAEVMVRLGESWELVLINDGSSDSSLDIVLELQATIPEIVLVDLSRNFGHQFALTSGLEIAKGVNETDRTKFKKSH